MRIRIILGFGSCLSLCLLLLSCESGTLSNGLTKAAQASNELATILNAVLQDKDFVEQAGREVKRSCGADPASCNAFRNLYTDAWAAHEGYLSAMRASVLLGGGGEDLQSVVDAEQMKASLFMQAVAPRLAGGRSIPVMTKAKLLTLPTSVRPQLHRLRQAQRNAIVAEFERQARWRAWDAL